MNSCFVCGGGVVQGGSRNVCLDCGDDGRAPRTVAHEPFDAVTAAARLLKQNKNCAVVVQGYSVGQDLLRFVFNISVLRCDGNRSHEGLQDLQSQEMIFLVRGKDQYNCRNYWTQALLQAMVAFVNGERARCGLTD